MELNLNNLVNKILAMQEIHNSADKEYIKYAVVASLVVELRKNANELAKYQRATSNLLITELG